MALIQMLCTTCVEPVIIDSVYLRRVDAGHPAVEVFGATPVYLGRRRSFVALRTDRWG